MLAGHFQTESAALYFFSPRRTLLWRRDDNLCYALLQGGKPEKGEGVMSNAKSIRQVTDSQMAMMNTFLAILSLFSCKEQQKKLVLSLAACFP